MNEKIQGVNPYINIYSARVLDDNNETTVSRLIAAIEWAIEENVNIIDINWQEPSRNQESNRL